jgi:hypothetical protein
MNMVVMVARRGAGRVTQRVFQTSFVIKYFVNEPLVKKGFNSSIDGDTIQ